MKRFIYLLAGLVALSCGGNEDVSSLPESSSSAPTYDDSQTGILGGSTNQPTLYGQPYYGGEFHRGPVDYSETSFHNACAPGTKYDPRIQKIEGNLLAGLWNGIPNVANYCDACIYVTTKKGKSALLRIVTYGSTSKNSIDVSPEAYKILNFGEYPRFMTWQFAKCPSSGPIVYEFKSGSHQWWTSLWVRNARVPIAKVEVKSVSHQNWTELFRESDGSLSRGGFGEGSFAIRTTAIDGQVVVDEFSWPSSGIGGALLNGKGNFD